MPTRKLTWKWPGSPSKEQRMKTKSQPINQTKTTKAEIICLEREAKTTAIPKFPNDIASMEI